MRKSLSFLIGIFLITFSEISYAQCAMCRTQLVNNVSHGDTALAAGLNLGILYLFFAPYLLLMVIGYLWFKNAKARKTSKLS